MVPFRARFNAVINDIYEIFINFKDVKTSFCTFTMLFTMICINYRSVSVGRERSAPPQKKKVCFYLKQGYTHWLIHVEGLFKVV